MRTLLLFCLLLPSLASYAEDRPEVKSIFLSDPKEKFSFHQPTYFIGGKDDLKLQFSFKYRMARKLPLYFAYTQLMFWDFYKESKPFRDTNYRPELFYRAFEHETSFLSSLDLGYMHLSNGRAEADSRSLERVFLRSNMFFRFSERQVGLIFQAHHLFDEDRANRDIIDHIGYWEAIFYLTKLVQFDRGHTDFELRTYAGSKGYDLDQGGVQVGLVHRFHTEDFNPALYVQYFEGYAENLLQYNRRRSHIRAGLLLSF